MIAEEEKKLTNNSISLNHNKENINNKNTSVFSVSKNEKKSIAKKSNHIEINNKSFIKENQQAYFKIQYEPKDDNQSNSKDFSFKFFVDKTICFIGRSKKCKNLNYKIKSIGNVAHIRIQSSRFISRRHIKIWWNNELFCWMIMNLSKVRIVVGDKVLKKGDSVKLDPITPVSSLSFKFYFIQSKQKDQI